MRNNLVSKSLIGGIILNFIFPFTFNGDFVTKPVFSWGNPALILFYALLLLILFSAVSKKDTENKGKVLLDKRREIPKTMLRSVLEMILGIIFLFLAPLIGGAILFWSGLSIKLVVLVCIGYIAILVYLGKKYYWKDLYK